MDRLEFMKGAFGIAGGASVVGEVVTGDAYKSHDADRFRRLLEEIAALREKVATSSPGDVLVRGARPKRGFIG